MVTNYSFFPAGYSMGWCPMGRAQLKNRMEGSGRRRLTGEPTFLTQVPKESDANTPSTLSIAFICLLHVQSPCREGSSLGTMGSVYSHGCVLGLGSGHYSWRVQPFTSICKCPEGASDSHFLSATCLCSLLFSLCLT